MTASDDDLDQRIAGVSSLAEPQRRALYEFVAARRDAVSKDDAAAALGIARSVAGFHLDRLVDDGLLTTEFRRLSGRQGPGAGRPAKLYRRAEGELLVSLPARRYDLAARLLADAVERAIRTGSPVGDMLEQAASECGRRLGERILELVGDRAARDEVIAAVVTALGELGYEPYVEGGEVALANCPFHALADERRELVCGMNLDLLVGLTRSLDGSGLVARLEPSSGHCCVRLDVTP